MKYRRRLACPRNKQIVQLLLIFAFGLCLYLSFPGRYRDTKTLDIQLDPEEQFVLGVEQNITKTRPSQNTHKIENMERNESLCHIPFVHGQMCPTIYTELGGHCKRDLSTPNGFDCPDIRRTGHNALRSTQLVLTRMLKIFDLVAKKHGVKYWITSGTLLGAARHRGFIPWDEDADVQIPLAEYVKLFNCCRNKFPEGTFLQNSETDPYLRPSSDKENRLLRHPVVGLYRRNWNPRIRDRKSCTRYCLVSGDCDWEDGLMIDVFIAEDTLPGHQLDGVFPLKEMFFEGFYFPVPNNWKDILSFKYGDYNTEIGESDGMNRVPEDNADPFHSCDELRQTI